MNSYKDLILSQIKNISNFYPNTFKYDEKNNYIEGELGFNRPYKGEYIEDRYCLRIFLNSYPKLPPSVLEIEEKIRRNKDNHVYLDHTLCLGPPIELLVKFKKDPSLFHFVDTILVPNLYWHSYKKNNGKEPWKAYSHGAEGIKEFRDKVNLKEIYFSILETNNLKVVLKLLDMAVRRTVMDNNISCPCGNGKKLNECHGILIDNLLNMPYLENCFIALDYWRLKDGLHTIRKSYRGF